MMAANPEMRKLFEAKLAGDSGRYPIARVWEKTW
jgi:hypothetical protein